MKRKNIKHLTIASLLCLGLMAADGAEARKIVKLNIPEEGGGGGAREKDNARAVQKQSTTPDSRDAVHLTGELRYTRGRGLTLGGTAIVIDANTGFFPGTEDGLRDPRSLSGKTVSVIGLRGSMGIEASLVIEQNPSLSESLFGTITQPEIGLRPSDSNSEVGEMTDETPR